MDPINQEINAFNSPSTSIEETSESSSKEQPKVNNPKIVEVVERQLPKEDFNSNEPSQPTLLGRIKNLMKTLAFRFVKILFSVAKKIYFLCAKVLFPIGKFVAAVITKIVNGIKGAASGIAKAAGAVFKGAAKCVAVVGKVFAKIVEGIVKHPKVAAGLAAVVAGVCVAAVVIPAVIQVVKPVFNALMFIPNLIMGK